MQNKKRTTYTKALLTSGMFYAGIIVGAIALVLYGICDKFGYVDAFVNASENLVVPMLGILAGGVFVYIVGSLLKVGSKTVCITESFIGLTIALCIGFTYLAFTSSIGLVTCIIIAAISLALAVLSIIIRAKKYDANAKVNTLKSNAAFTTYYKSLFKKYGVVSVILAVLAVAAMILLERADVVGYIINGNSIKVVAIVSLVSIAVLFLMMVVARLKSKEIGIVDVAAFTCLGGSIGLIPVAFMVGDVFRTLAFIILAVALVVVIVLTVLLIKNTHIYTDDEENAIEYGKNGIIAYFKSLFKKANFFALLGVSVIITAAVVFAEGINFIDLLINALNLESGTVLTVIAITLMAFVALLVIADVKNHRINGMDSALLVLTLASIFVSVCDFTILGVELSTEVYIALSGAVIGIALIITRSVFVKILDEKVETVSEIATEKEVEEVSNEVVTAVEEAVEDVETVEQIDDNAEESVQVVDETSTQNEQQSEIAAQEEIVNEPIETVVEESAVEEAVEENEELAATEEPVKLKRVNSKKTLEIYLRTGDDQLKENYSALKNAFYVYGVHSRLTKTRENFSKKGVSMSKVNPEKALHLQAKLLVRGKFVKLFINLDPTTLDAKYFRHSDASKKSPDQPTLLKIRSKLSLKRAIELIDKLAEQEGYTKKKKFVPVDYKAELSDENLTYMQKLGFDYMVKDSVTYDEVKVYNDEFAKKLLKTEVIAKPERYIYDEITLEAIADNFESDEVADLEAMRVKGLIKINANSVTVKPSATLSKKLIVVANVIDPKAAEMIAIAGGESTQLVEG